MKVIPYYVTDVIYKTVKPSYSKKVKLFNFFFKKFFWSRYTKMQQNNINTKSYTN